MSCNHRFCGDVIERPECYLLRLLHGQTASTIIHLTFGLELHPLGLFRPSLIVMGVEQATSLSPEIVGFMIC